MDRRKFIVLSSGVAAGSSMSALGLTAGSERPRERRAPNVIFMICDDLGYGDLGCYGSRIPTPNLDAMAAEGLRLTRFNAAHPICSASRAALLTGRYGHRSGTTGAFGPSSQTGTSLEETLLSNLFHAAGYKTKAIGKWHLGNAGAYLPTNRGFDSFFGVPYSDDFYPLPLIRDTTVVEQDTDRDLLTPRYTAEAVKYIEEQRKGEPFFLYHAFSYPHDPARASERFRGKTRLGDYGDAVAEIDWSVGEILRAVERKGLGEDTLICFTSDHGPWYQGSPGLLRGRKGSSFEGGFRVPFVTRWPGRIARGKVDDAWYSNLDILPSLAALCGLGLPSKPLDGIDVSAMLGGETGKEAEAKARLYFCSMGNHGLDVHCVRKGNWKLRVAQGVGEVYLNDRTTGSKKSEWLQRPELYDLGQDPCESYDVAKFHPEIVAELSKDLEALMPSFPANVVDAYTELKQRKGDISTPPGASPRPFGKPNPVWSWEPKDRR